jgi:hypothetical protein
VPPRNFGLNPKGRGWCCWELGGVPNDESSVQSLDDTIENDPPQRNYYYAMKIWTASLALAVAILAGSSSPTNAIRLSGKYTSNPELTAKIMEHAQYYYPPNTDGNGRDLEEGADASSFEITAAHTILFRSCESLTVQADFGSNDDDSGLSDTLKSMYQAGQLKAEKSYILFDVCLSEYCDSGKASDHTTFITDMASFINAFLQFIPNKTQAYCQGCFDNQAYCSTESQKYYTSSGSGSSSSSSSGGNRQRMLNNGNVERTYQNSMIRTSVVHPILSLTSHPFRSSRRIH